MRNIFAALIVSFTLSACGHSYEEAPPLVRTEFVVIEPSQAIIDRCVRAITKDDVPDGRITEADHTIYTKKLEDAYLLCRNGMIEIDRNAEKAKQDLNGRN